MRPTALRPLLSVLVLFLVVAALALGSRVWSTSSGEAPSDRAAIVATDGCGSASGGEASGVAVGGDLVLTAAHVVARANEVEVTLMGGAAPARIVAWDAERDLALLAVTGLDMEPVPLGVLAAGDSGELVGGALSGTVAFETLQVARLNIEKVLGIERHSRVGYQLAVAAGAGDSGAGIYTDGDELAAMLFATEPAEGIGWATASSEIETLLAGPRRAFRCDPAVSRIEPS